MSMSDQKGSKLTILQHLRIHGSMSRIELTRLTGLSRATVSISIAELMEHELVYETDDRQATKGRPATSVELVPYSRIILGADLDHAGWTLGAFDLLGNVVETVKIPIASFEAQQTFRRLADEVGRFVERIHKPVMPLIGLGVPGLVDRSHRVIRSAADLDWYQVDAEQLMRDATGLQPVVVNRYRARGLTECRYGAGQQFANMIYIGVGTGIAAGIYLDRQLMSGSLGGAGEIGHLTIEPDGPLCACGNSGCLQLLAAAPAIEQLFRKRLRAGENSVLISDPNIDIQLLRADSICQAAEQGDELAAKVVKQAATYLGIAMANLLNTLNPEAFVLGGSVPNMSPLYVETATKVMQRRAMSPLSGHTSVHTSQLQDIGGALGAANFAFDKHISIDFFK